MSGQAPHAPLMQAALALVKHGWPVFPCRTDKKPRVKGGFKAASTDLQQVKACWEKWPDASIGVPTGAVTGFFVLDVDLPHGPASLATLEAEHGALPGTAEQCTGGGGRQLLFQMPTDMTIKNSAGALGKGLDVRGDGGYIIVPPSGHPSGGHYAWTSPKGTPPATPPQWLLDLVDKQPPKKPVSKNIPASGNTTEYGRKALENECAGLAMTGKGGRNQALNDAAFALGQLVAGGEIGQKEAETELLNAALQSGLPESEALKTLASGLQAGLKEPRTAPEKQKYQIKAHRPNTPNGFPFIEKEDGVYFQEEQHDGGIELRWLCSPLRVLALTRDVEGQEWGRLLEVIDPDGVTHRWAMPMTMLAGNGDSYRSQLMNMGMRLTPGIPGKNRLHMLLSLANPEARARCVPRIGWHDRRFVLPDGVYGQENGEEILLQGTSIDMPFRVSGTLKDWKDKIGSYCVGNSRLVFAVSVALAAPLLHIVGAENGGFHFVGASSKGKTTLLQVGGSVCGGGGLNGFLRQWRATSNGLEAVATAHCDSLLCLDELSQIAAKEAGEVAYLLANGQGKTRAGRTGEGRKPAEWRTLFLSTGEICLADKVREDGRGRTTAGQAVRVVDIPADAGRGLGIFETLHGFHDGDHFARHLKEHSRTTYGAPLRAFLKQVTARLDGITHEVKSTIRRFLDMHCPTHSDGQVVRVAGRFALAAAAGELGIAAGILPWPSGEAEQAAATCFTAWLHERGGAGAAETLQAIAQVRAFIEAHGSSRFESLDSDGETRIINRVGYRKRTDVHTRYCFLQETFRSEVCAGLNIKTVCTALKEAGYMVTEHGRNTLSMRTPEGKQKLYVVTSAILSGDAGDTGGTPVNAEPPPPPEKDIEPGTPGTTAGVESQCPHRPQSQNATRGQENAHDSNTVPTVPIVPGKNIRHDTQTSAPSAHMPKREAWL